MSICRTTIVEYHSEADADAMTADYIANFESMFPECEKSINSRVGPTTVVSNSVDADEAAIEKNRKWPQTGIHGQTQRPDKKCHDLHRGSDAFKIIHFWGRQSYH